MKEKTVKSMLCPGIRKTWLGPCISSNWHWYFQGLFCFM